MTVNFREFIRMGFRYETGCKKKHSFSVFCQTFMKKNAVNKSFQFLQNFAFVHNSLTKCAYVFPSKRGCFMKEILCNLVCLKILIALYILSQHNPLSTRPHQNVVWYNNSWLGVLKILKYVPKEREKYTAKNEPSFVTVTCKCCDGS